MFNDYSLCISKINDSNDTRGRKRKFHLTQKLKSPISICSNIMVQINFYPALTNIHSKISERFQKCCKPVVVEILLCHLFLCDVGKVI